MMTASVCSTTHKPISYTSISLSILPVSQPVSLQQTVGDRKRFLNEYAISHFYFELFVTANVSYELIQVSDRVIF